MGKRVKVDGVGFGMLRFFGAAGEDSQCGVELEDPLVSRVRRFVLRWRMMKGNQIIYTKDDM